MTQAEIIKKKCKDAGLTVYSVLKEAKVDRSTITNWTRKEPNAFGVLDKINEAIKKMKNGK